MRPRLSRVQVLLGVLLAATVVMGAVWLTTRGSTRSIAPVPEGQSYAALVRANYRVLTPTETRRLLRFAQVFSSCMEKHIDGFGEPKTSNTKIEMRLPAGVSVQQAIQFATPCGEALGDPSPRSSLVLKGHVIELYLPKKCLLDPKVVAATRRPT